MVARYVVMEVRLVLWDSSFTNNVDNDNTLWYTHFGFPEIPYLADFNFFDI
jgi:hypothetical protein